MNQYIKKYGLVALLALGCFAAGRYSNKALSEKELHTKLETQREEISRTYELQLKQMEEYYANEVKTAKSKVVTRVVIKKPDGTVIERENTKENTNTAENSSGGKKETSTDTKTTEESKAETQKEESNVKVVTKAPPPFRVYGAAAIVSPQRNPTVAYGPGFSYDMWIFNLGAFGLYAPNSENHVVGATVGVSF